MEPLVELGQIEEELALKSRKLRDRGSIHPRSSRKSGCLLLQVPSIKGFLDSLYAGPSVLSGSLLEKEYLCLIEHFGTPQIGNFTRIILRYQNIQTFDIPVHNMKIVEKRHSERAVASHSESLQNAQRVGIHLIVEDTFTSRSVQATSRSVPNRSPNSKYSITIVNVVPVRANP